MPVILQRFFWTAHRWVGLICGTIFLLSVITGFSMMFEREFNMQNAAPLAAEATTLAGLNAGVAAVQASHPDLAVRFLLPPPDRSHAWLIFTSPRSGELLPHRLSSIDPATGDILSDMDYDRTTKGFLIDIHHSLLSGAIGHNVMLIVSIGLVFLSISGFIILRRRWRTLRTNPFTAPGNRWRAIHRWAGVTAGILVITWGVTGFLLLFPAVVADWHGAFKPGPVSPIPFSVSLESVLTRADVTREGEIYNVGLPSTRSPQLTVTILRRDALPWNKFVQLKLDPTSGEVVKRIAPEAQPPAVRWINAEQAVHQGLYATKPVHIAYMFAAIFPFLIVLSGPIAWWRRLAAQRLKRSASDRDSALSVKPEKTLAKLAQDPEPIG